MAQVDGYARGLIGQKPRADAPDREHGGHGGAEAGGAGGVVRGKLLVPCERGEDLRPHGVAGNRAHRKGVRGLPGRAEEPFRDGRHPRGEPGNGVQPREQCGEKEEGKQGGQNDCRPQRDPFRHDGEIAVGERGEEKHGGEAQRGKQKRQDTAKGVHILRYAGKNPFMPLQRALFCGTLNLREQHGFIRYDTGRRGDQAARRAHAREYAERISGAGAHRLREQPFKPRDQTGPSGKLNFLGSAGERQNHARQYHRQRDGRQRYPLKRSQFRRCGRQGGGGSGKERL